MSNKQSEALKLALEALESCTPGDYSTGHVISPSYDESNVEAAITAIREALADHIAEERKLVEPAQQQEPPTVAELLCVCGAEWEWRNRDWELVATPQPTQQQEPVAKPYAYEYGRDNGDGTYSVVIEKGDLVQTAPAVYNYVRPRNAHKDWPIKELFDLPPAQPSQSRSDVKPLTDAQIGAVAADIWGSILIAPQSYQAFARAIEQAHGITGETK